MGSAAAAHLAARGVRTLGLEQFTPAHALGSGHGDSRVIRQAYSEDPAYVPLLLRSYELDEDLCRDDDGIFVQTGGLMMGTEQSVTFAGSWRARNGGDCRTRCSAARRSRGGARRSRRARTRWILTDLALTGSTRHPIELFDPARFAAARLEHAPAWQPGCSLSAGRRIPGPSWYSRVPWTVPPARDPPARVRSDPVAP